MSIDRETYDKAASAFMIDLSQVSLALRGSTQRSLIILDEFGKGVCWRYCGFDNRHYTRRRRRLTSGSRRISSHRTSTEDCGIDPFSVR